MKIIILAGGKGKRLWPISRESFPKQFLKIGDDFSFLQKTVKRFASRYAVDEFLIVTNKEYYYLVQNQLEALGINSNSKILIEPCSRNTAPAIAFAVNELLKRGTSPQETVLISSSDCVFSPESAFTEQLDLAHKLAKSGKIVSFGIPPLKPEIGYGYIKIPSAQNSPYYLAEAFIEKPRLEIAETFVASGQYLWNLGIYAFTIEKFINELKKYNPKIWELIQGDHPFEQMPEISIDFAITEKTQDLAVIPLDVSWSDVGCWDSIYEILAKDAHQNAKVGQVLDVDTKNSLIIGNKRIISTVGLEDLLIVDTEDALFIGKKGESQKVKALVDELNKRGKKESLEHITSYRPWGTYTILEESSLYKVKRIIVEPLQSLSWQMHHHRSEHWVVVKGVAKVTIGDHEQYFHENESVYVARSTIHRLENPGKIPLELIEVQVGSYLKEDDIVRFEDQPQVT